MTEKERVSRSVGVLKCTNEEYGRNKKKIDPQTTNVMDQGTSFPA